MNDSKDEERNQIRDDLSSMSFEQLIKLKDELGTKVYNEAIFGESTRVPKQETSPTSYKRANKNRPREMSSKRQVPLLGGLLGQKTESSAVRDPRFDDQCGEFKKDIFKKNYEFVNDIRENEVCDLKKKLKKTSDVDKKSALKFAIQRLENQIREEKKRKIRAEVLKEEQVEIIKAKEEGKKPWFASKKEQKVKELVKQFEDYKQSGRLVKHLEKRRKKNVSKDRKKFRLD